MPFDHDSDSFRDELEQFSERVSLLIPNPAQVEATDEQLLICLSEWDELEPLARLQKDPAAKDTYAHLLKTMDLVRCRLRLVFITKEVNLVTLYAGWQTAECVLETMRIRVEALRLLPDNEATRAKFGRQENEPEVDENQLIGVRMEEAEAAEALYLESMKQLKMNWPREWCGHLLELLKEEPQTPLMESPLLKAHKDEADKICIKFRELTKRADA